MTLNARLTKLEAAMPPQEQTGGFMDWFCSLVEYVYCPDEAEKKKLGAALGEPPEPADEGERRFVEQMKTVYGDAGTASA
jgi:hypothetical protein